MDHTHGWGLGGALAPSVDRIIGLNAISATEESHIFFETIAGVHNSRLLLRPPDGAGSLQKNPRDPTIQRAEKLNALKPHIAEEAVRIVDEKRQQAKS